MPSARGEQEQVMSIEVAPVVTTSHRSMAGFQGVTYVDVEALGVAASPVAAFDDFRVKEMPFSPHPHAGFAAVTYVLRDSVGAARSRASSGVDVTVGPGGVIWTDSGSGIVHEEVPADPSRELHGLQLFVNRSAGSKLAAPKVEWLDAEDVPAWRDPSGNVVHVVAGSFGEIRSPISPIEPFVLLDADVMSQITFEQPSGYNTVVYVPDGEVLLSAPGATAVTLHAGQATAIQGGPAAIGIVATRPSSVIVAGGPSIDDPIVMRGSFMMNDLAQIDAAIKRYQAGEMGYLEPVLPGQRS
jgi:redox-sensitive bicupin YhaK (pirin superfamily)